MTLSRIWPSLKKWMNQPRPGTWFFLVTWLFLLASGRTRLFRDPGTFWHTVVGDQIIRSGHLIYVDTYTFTFAGHRWIAHQWLGECLMAIVHRLAGMDGLLLASATLLATVLAWVGTRLVQAGLHWSLAAVFVAIVAAAGASHFHVRPHLATILLLAWSFGLLCDVETGSSPKRRLLLLVPAFALWTNLHGGTLGGLCTLSLAFVGWCAVGLLFRTGPVRSIRDATMLGGILLACALSTLASPYGLSMIDTWHEIMAAEALPRIIQEHSPLRPMTPDGVAVMVLGALYVVVLVTVPARRWRVCWIIPLIWLYLATGRVRHAPLFAVTAGLGLGQMLPESRLIARLARSGSDWFRQPNCPPALCLRSLLLPGALVASAVAIQVAGVSLPVLGRGWAKPDAEVSPDGLTAELRRDSGGSSPASIFNEYAYGGFLIYHSYFGHLGKGYRVFVDDRCELFGGSWLSDFVAAESVDTASHVSVWEREYGRFPLALTRSDSGYDEYFRWSSEWVRVSTSSEGANLYRRRPGETRDLAQASLR